MKVSIGADHAGFPLKQEVAAHLREQGHEVIDLGTNSTDPVDYPDFAEAVGKSILDGTVKRAVLICGSGVGASVRVIGVALAKELVDNYMRAAFTHEERHERRLNKVMSIEERYGKKVSVKSSIH